MNLIEMIELFQEKNVPYLSNHVLNPPNNHHTIIGQWARWWIEDTNNGAKRGIFDEALACKGRRHADIMFLQKANDNIFEIKGVAEIENNIECKQDKYLEKLECLKIYDELEDKFPDLEFVILSTIMGIDKNDEFIDFFTPLLKKVKEYSKESDLYWVIFILEVIDNRRTPREFHAPEYYKNSITYVWFNEYYKEGAYVILKSGEEIAKVNWPE